jgi:hypothetical protein
MAHIGQTEFLALVATKITLKRQLALMLTLTSGAIDGAALA